MTKKQIAEQLNNSEYPLHIPQEIAAAAKAAGIVIVYGASDNLMEFDGAIYDEVGAYEGATAIIVNGTLWTGPDCDHDGGDGCKHAQAAHAAAKAHGKKIEALWCAEGEYSWTYKTEIPHVTFEITEDGEPYCQGIVFELKDCG